VKVTMTVDTVSKPTAKNSAVEEKEEAGETGEIEAEEVTADDLEIRMTVDTVLVMGVGGTEEIENDETAKVENGDNLDITMAVVAVVPVAVEEEEGGQKEVAEEGNTKKEEALLRYRRGSLRSMSPCEISICPNYFFVFVIFRLFLFVVCWVALLCRVLHRGLYTSANGCIVLVPFLLRVHTLRDFRGGEAKVKYKQSTRSFVIFVKTTV